MNPTSVKLGNLENPNWTPPEYSTSGWTPVPHFNPITGQYYNENLPQTVIIYTQQNPNEPIEIPVNLPNMNNENCNCVTGTPYIENGICKCANADAPEPQVKDKIVTIENGKPIIYYINAPQKPQTESDILSFIKDNPLLIGGAILALILLTQGKK